MSKKLTAADAKMLDTIVPRFGTNKATTAVIEKVIKADNAALKEIMGKYDLSNYSAGGFTASCSATNKASFNEDQLIEVIKKMKKSKDIIKKREYVDMDALESAIYNGKIDAAKLACCQEETTIVTLRIKKDK